MTFPFISCSDSSFEISYDIKTWILIIRTVGNISTVHGKRLYHKARFQVLLFNYSLIELLYCSTENF